MTKLYDLDQVCETYFFPQEAWRDLSPTDEAEPVKLSLADGTSIGGYWFHALADAPTILYFHGNGECIADQLDHWPVLALKAGANIFFVDYPGYASSDGIPTFSSCCEAASQALDYLLDRAEKIVVFGRSVGSIFALDAAYHCSSPKVCGLGLESGVADLKQRLEIRVPYEQVGIDRAKITAQLDQDFNHQKKVEGLKIPLLVLHTVNDDLVPSWHAEKLASWAGKNLSTLALFERGDHNSIQSVNRDAYQSHLREFIKLFL